MTLLPPGVCLFHLGQNASFLAMAEAQVLEISVLVEILL
jgi:hypothetical protein